MAVLPPATCAPMPVVVAVIVVVARGGSVGFVRVRRVGLVCVHVRAAVSLSVGPAVTLAVAAANAAANAAVNAAVAVGAAAVTSAATVTGVGRVGLRRVLVTVLVAGAWIWHLSRAEAGAASLDLFQTFKLRP